MAQTPASSILGIVPGVLPLACADSKFAPVYVGDVVEAFVRCLQRRDVAGRTYQLCGPDVVTLGDIVRTTARTLGLRRWVLPVPRTFARVQAAIDVELPSLQTTFPGLPKAPFVVFVHGERDALPPLKTVSPRTMFTTPATASKNTTPPPLWEGPGVRVLSRRRTPNIGSPTCGALCALPIV